MIHDLHTRTHTCLIEISLHISAAYMIIARHYGGIRKEMQRAAAATAQDKVNQNR
jgi:hypothetical protein